MRRLRVLLTLCLSALLMACQPPARLMAPPVVQAAALLQGQLQLPNGYEAQANAGQVRANATVTLIDPSTYQAKGTGITAPDGTFTVQALPTFTPTLGSLYLLESNKTLGGAGNAAFRLRTLVQYTASGWTSVTGSAIQLSSATTAVAILWDHQGLAATDVLSKVTYDATTRTHRFTNLTTTLTEGKLREVENLVIDALLVGADPIQVVRPGPGGHYGLSLTDRSRNMLVNTGFEVGANPLNGWRLYNPSVATYSAETAIVYDASQSLKVTATAAGDSWMGQGFNGAMDTFGLPLASGTVYTFTVYARGAVGGEKLAMCLNYQSPFFETRSSTFTLTTAWQRYTWTLVSDYTTDRALFVFRFGSGIGQASFPATLYLDNVQMEAGGAATAYSPKGNLLLEGFANSLDSANLTPTTGKVGRAVVVDNGLNLLANSSFEIDSNADGLPDGMTMYNTPGGTYALDPANALFHGNALKITKPGVSGEYVGFTQNKTYQAGKTYTFSVWVKGDNVSGAPNANDFGVAVEPYLVPGTPSTSDWTYGAAPTGTFDWTRVAVTVTFRRTCTYLVALPMFRKKSGTVWFDGFQIEENAMASPYAGDGPDRLTFDANRFVNPLEGTIAFWYKPTYGWDDAAGTGILMALSNLGPDIVGQFSKASTGTGSHYLRFGIRRETLTEHDWLYATYTPSAPLWKAGEWHHVALSWGQAGMSLYLDGAPVATNPYNGGIWTTSSAVHATPNLGLLSFAGTGRNYTAQMNGALDGLKVWDTQRTTDSVRREFLGLAL